MFVHPFATLLSTQGTISRTIFSSIKIFVLLKPNQRYRVSSFMQDEFLIEIRFTSLVI